MTSTVESEILELEERLRLADLTPDPDFFQTYLDDQMVLMADGDICSYSPKSFIVDRHRPGKAQKFDRIKITEMKILIQGETAIVTCVGNFEGPGGNFGMTFMRVWVKKADGWRVVAGAMSQLDSPAFLVKDQRSCPSRNSSPHSYS